MLNKAPIPRRMSTLSILSLFPWVRGFQKAKKSKALKMLTQGEMSVLLHTRSLSRVPSPSRSRGLPVIEHRSL
jgi:hypothetical protein